MKYKVISTALCLILLMVVSGLGFSENEYKWVVDSDVSGRSMASIAYGNGVFVQVGNDGRIETSDNGVKWIPQDSNTIVNLNQVIWNGKQFLASGSHAEILTSDNGTSWVRQAPFSNPNAYFKSLVWNGDFYMGSSSDFGMLYYSNDGVSWTNEPAFFKSSYEHFNTLIWNGNEFIGTAQKTIYRSVDGHVWTPISTKGLSNVSSVDGIAYNGKTYVAISTTKQEVYVSSDLISWKTVKIDSFFLENIKYIGNRFIAVGRNHRVSPDHSNVTGTVMSSIDGLKWNKTVNKTNNRTTDVAFNGKLYVVSTTIESPNNNELVGESLISNDGISWSKITLGTNEPFNSIATNGKTLVALNQEGFILTKSSGSSWKRANLKDTYMRKVIWDGKRYIAVGSAEYTSKDGYIWVKESCKYLSSKISATSRNYIFNKGKLSSNVTDIHFNGKQYIAVGEWGLLMRSSDAKNWTLLPTNTKRWIETLTWNGKRYVANVDDPYMRTLYSADGLNWKTTDMNATKCFSTEVASNGSNFVMVAQNAIGNAPKPGAFLDHRLFNNYIFTSSDGVKWNKIDLKHEDTYRFVIWTGKTYIIGSDTRIMRSTDGVKWEEITPTMFYGIAPNDAVQFENEIYTVGEHGGIMHIAIE